MPILDTIRKNVFWTLDFFKGGHIAKHLREVKYLNENSTSELSDKVRDRNLNELLSHAITTSPYYKERVDSVLLKDFPIINKTIIREFFEEFKSNIHKDCTKYKVASSGSTGTPFKLYQDFNKHSRNIADTIYFGERAGYQLGQKLIFMRVWTDQNRKNPILAWMQNIDMQNVANLGDEEIEKFINRISADTSVKGILSYASSLEAVCKFLDRSDYSAFNANVNSIIANSERLNKYTYDSIKKYFNTNIVSRYSNAENGILAQQKVENPNEFEINWASYHIEILNFDSDEPVKIGELGRVIVTDLFNYCMPIIRYDTGDVGSIKENEDGITVFTQVEGRKQDMVYNTSGDLISAMVIGGIMKKYQMLTQYQFIQESKKEYLFKLNTENKFEFEQKMINEFKEVLGEDAQIAVKYLDEIPLLASGKRRQVVNNYN